MANKIYLAGSFFDFRDKIISSLPEFDFSDPRKHRQHSIASLVEDDMEEAKSSRVLLACFPKGKSRGTMTYAEIGASKTAGNMLIVADETSEPDFLTQLADKYFCSIDKAIDFIKNGLFQRINESDEHMPPEYFDMKKANSDEKFRIFLSSSRENFPFLSEIKENGKKIIAPEDMESLEDLGRMDLTLTYLKKGMPIDRRAVFFMGMAYATEIPNILIEENPVAYPPLLGLARRVFSGKNGQYAAADYISQLESQEIDKEAKIMYELFKTYNTKS